ncbi:MAG: PhzF family phenazine biosynthesis protein [Planctomycetia bacterium]|nr:PhzF family phenazine biosynthesis protein [Planctomycetia bacterium]
MSIPIYIVDAFAGRPFQGNPAAICPLEAPAEAGWMQSVAAEMNLSETAFLVPREGGSFGLRWFTPAVEVDLCGHATLASAHLLWEQTLAPADEPIRFETRSGLLTCSRRGEKIELDFPAEPPAPVPSMPELSAALGAEPISVGRNRFDLIAEFASEADVLALRPDYGLLGAIPARGTIATARSADPRFDFVSRFFAPAVGVNEDPVCGSAHCCLGPFWGEKLKKTEMLGHQISARGGIIGVRLNGRRVALSGTAVTVLSGRLTA